MEITKEDWILLKLREAPMDRIHIMKALFLIWNRSQRNLPNYFEFVPYLYGPCSFEVYSTLENLQRNDFIVQPPYPPTQWSNYYLTRKGEKKVEEICKKVTPEILKIIKEVVNEISKLTFIELLQKVYSEAPDFINNSLFKNMIKI